MARKIKNVRWTYSGMGGHYWGAFHRDQSVGGVDLKCDELGHRYAPHVRTPVFKRLPSTSTLADAKAAVESELRGEAAKENQVAKNED